MTSTQNIGIKGDTVSLHRRTSVSPVGHLLPIQSPALPTLYVYSELVALQHLIQEVGILHFCKVARRR